MSPESIHFERSLDDDLQSFLKARLADAYHAKEQLEQAKAQLDKELTAASRYVSDCESRLESLGLSLPGKKEISQSNQSKNPYLKGPLFESLRNNSSDNSYDTSWGYIDKIQYVLRNPSKYGFTLFRGASSIVKAIFQEEPNFKPDTKTALIQIAPQVSRVVKVGGAVKLQPYNNKVDFYFISATWFDDEGHIKPEYKAILEGLNLPLSKQ